MNFRYGSPLTQLLHPLSEQGYSHCLGHSSLIIHVQMFAGDRHSKLWMLKVFFCPWGKALMTILYLSKGYSRTSGQLNTGEAYGVPDTCL